MGISAKELADIFGEDVVTEAREPGSDDGDPTPVAAVSELIEAANAPNPQIVGKLHVSAPGFNPSIEAPAAVLPPDAPPNDASAPPPAKAKRGQKAKNTSDQRTFPEDDAEAAIAKAKAAEEEWNAKVAAMKEEAAAPRSVHAKPPHTVDDGPGWQTVNCSACGQDLGKRPPGHVIDPSLCPNKAAHPKGETLLELAERVAGDAVASRVMAPVNPEFVEALEKTMETQIRTAMQIPDSLPDLAPPPKTIIHELGPETRALLERVLHILAACVPGAKG